MGRRLQAGNVARNVELYGVDIGGLSEDERPVSETARELAAMPIELVVDDVVYRPPPATSAWCVDEVRTTESAAEVGDDSFVLARPFRVGGVAPHTRQLRRSR